jgi:hypothetical protein
MAQLDSSSDRELEEALKKGELGPRKSAFAKESKVLGPEHPSARPMVNGSMEAVAKRPRPSAL